MRRCQAYDVQVRDKSDDGNHLDDRLPDANVPGCATFCSVAMNLEQLERVTPNLREIIQQGKKRSQWKRGSKENHIAQLWTGETKESEIMLNKERKAAWI